MPYKEGTEKAFTEEVRKVARTLGWLEMHPFDSRRTTAGFPDLTMVRKPRVVFAELKLDVKRSKLSPAQIVWKEELEQCKGVEYYLWRPSNWEEIIGVLR